MSVAAVDARPYDHAFFGHPRGLSIAVLHRDVGALQLLRHARAADALHDRADRGRRPRLRHGVAGAVYGLYTSMVYMTSLPGGWIADRLIGQRRAVLYGGIIIACGHFSMAVQSLTTFYIGLALIVVGTGLLKANAAVMVGALYATAGRAPRRRLLHLLHGHQPRRLHRAAGLRLSRPARQLALRLRRRGRRHGAAASCSTSPARSISATPGCTRRRPRRPRPRPR